MTKYRESKAPITTTTYDKNSVEGETDNIYEALSIISKACDANQFRHQKRIARKA